ncbi:4-hydroxy-tetrahydrodipicolinate synthase/N-acetylneuraminate lyase [Edwardsiella anguillarum]|uniref:dihydrodipicolinate synthase family protein n=1 Tax=Edwardsiella TaxID=635 RepID=UPI00045D2C41|nr:dihydrodipicolinate synthase family protein [Edwardsiella anguillarum]AKM48520.1 N-acetylneuraminate lyase [Edwardsiella sp. EA181011]GAJ67775.1 N-acetylneuraminate lyase [Edwardsiella piscicida]RFS99653.1 N-acetylneuraminate lyase [Edwardsiella anguillarum]BET80159.1 4-hydroxy-tetrahydrodipicolinate synthase/N-acetylneuraminate lyase [Edwardsiella anguillarum]BET83448.1 4-hydroxy-tetrahydrodipicolinate synthase/N-acetylneuraminate lyase [Edwardsiella anguillarum]
MKKLTGLIAAPHTPFKADGSVNYPVIDRIAEHLIADGVTGAYVLGTTGEGIQCSVEERMRIAERWVDASQGKLDLIVHTGALSIADAVTLARHANTLDIMATSVIGPCFFKPGSVDDLVEYCRLVAEAAPDKGFYYYHSSMSGLSIDMERFLQSASGRIPNLSGMKFNASDMYEYQRCLRVENGRFDIPFGVDEFMPAGLACGATSAVGSTYNYAAPLYLRLMESFHRGDMQDVARCMDKVIAIIRVLVEYGGVAAGKVAMQLHGIDVGDPRRPLRPMTTQQKADALAKFRAAEFL